MEPPDPARSQAAVQAALTLKQRGQLNTLKALSRSAMVTREMFGLRQELAAGKRSIQEIVIPNEQEWTYDGVARRRCEVIAVVGEIERLNRQLIRRKPSTEEIAKRLGVPSDEVQKVLEVAQLPVSLDTPIGQEQDAYLGDFIEDPGVISAAEVAISNNLKQCTAAVLKTLTSREEKIIKMRFGLDDGNAHTLEEVGQSFAVTRERIRQIEAKALRKLRRQPRSEGLRDLLSAF